MTEQKTLSDYIMETTCVSGEGDEVIELSVIPVDKVIEKMNELKDIFQSLADDDRHTDDYRRGMRSAINFINQKLGEKLIK